MTSPIDIRPDHLSTVWDVLRENLPPGVRVWAFGSRTDWTTKDSSDLDLALEGDGKIGPQVMRRLQNAFEESNLPYNVDVVDIQALTGNFKQIVQSQRVPLPPGAWRDVTLGELCEFRAGSVFKLQYQGKASGHFPFIKVRDMNLPENEVSINESTNWIDQAVAKKIRAKPIPEGSIVFAKIGEALKQNRLRMTVHPTIIDNNMMGAIPKTDIIEPRFLFYGMHQFDFGEIASGTALPYLTMSDLAELPLSLPPLPEQRTIAGILGALDDKIELNRRMNGTLEAMARALFKSWFVDFDPVRAKMEGGDTGLPKEIADLFPDRLVDSELGEIPEGWGLQPLPELMEINPTRVLKRGRTAPYVDMASMPTRGHVPEKILERPFGSGMRFANGDTLLARITPCLENGKTAYVDFLGDEEVGWGSTEYIVLKPMPPLPDEFAYCLARSARFREFAIKNMSGTSGRQRVPASALFGFSIPSPPAQLAAEFGRTVRSLLTRGSQATQESRTLTALRDLLLPTLLSGKLRVE